MANGGNASDPDYLKAKQYFDFAWGLVGKTIRSEEHTSELQSLTNLVCRLLLEKKKKIKKCFRSEGANSTSLRRVNLHSHMHSGQSGEDIK